MWLHSFTSQVVRTCLEHHNFLAFGNNKHDLRRKQSESAGNNWKHIDLEWKRLKYDPSQVLINCMMVRWFKIVKLWKLVCVPPHTTTPRLPHDYLTTTPRLHHDFTTTTPRLPHDYLTTTLNTCFHSCAGLSIGKQKSVEFMCFDPFWCVCLILCIFQAISMNMYDKSIISWGTHQHITI